LIAGGSIGPTPGGGGGGKLIGGGSIGPTPGGGVDGGGGGGGKLTGGWPGSTGLTPDSITVGWNSDASPGRALLAASGANAATYGSPPAAGLRTAHRPHW